VELDGRMNEVHEQVDGIDGGVVVGLDDSDCSRAALVAAAEEARLRGCPLHVVRAWQVATAPRPSSWSPGYVPSFPEYESAVEEWVDAQVRQSLGADSGLEVRAHAVHAGAASALVAASKKAHMVVVGSRGRGGFRGLLLGSTSEQVVRHAHCPVLVVRAVG
jgi:nucleotide-binding universal stress UspA family protein